LVTRSTPKEDAREHYGTRCDEEVTRSGQHRFTSAECDLEQRVESNRDPGEHFHSCVRLTCFKATHYRLGDAHACSELGLGDAGAFTSVSDYRTEKAKDAPEDPRT
jgi:hypothetical protein